MTGIKKLSDGVPQDEVASQFATTQQYVNAIVNFRERKNIS